MATTLGQAISKLETAAQFSTFLDRAIVHSVSWGGERMVRVEGYKDSIETHVFVRRFLDQAPTIKFPSTLIGRLEWYDLFTRMQALCSQSDEAWKSTYIGLVISERSAQDSMDMIRDVARIRDPLLGFKKIDFIRFWPDKRAMAENHDDETRFRISREMLAEAVEKTK